ncbi:LANO_0H10330g1_1 [Lachancea nothofagi CBS 11611]|uniref:LANO_0H10330g1_1 n=1 Tax=Lachancea nothofagi CBS 11611 TaxID=1266666 RepID=A0A1G4KM41_9SACH|nr:LANO_0H10330g1_1 [Lachancea nothofagi CBS 11611]
MAINRLTLGMNRVSNYAVFQKWKITDVMLCVLLYVINIPIYYAKPFERQFYLNDPTISHPHAGTQRVGSVALFVYSLVVPVVTIVVFSLVLADPKHRVYLMYISLLGLFLSWTSTNLLTDFLKNWIGRPRPDFLARCEPREGTPLNVLVTASEVCMTENIGRLMDGFRSTPSGHSSESFSGLGYLYLWLTGQLLAESPSVGQWRKTLAFLPLVGATTIAISRTEDYRHHFVDVILGSVIGMFIAYKTYSANFPPVSSELPFKPFLDDSDIGLVYSDTAKLITDEEAEPLSST